MRLDTWGPAAAVRYDQQLWNELVSLRFTEAAHGALILGPVGVGKTHLATALQMTRRSLGFTASFAPDRSGTGHARHGGDRPNTDL